jgi:hypothetical protein
VIEEVKKMNELKSVLIDNIKKEPIEVNGTKSLSSSTLQKSSTSTSTPSSIPSNSMSTSSSIPSTITSFDKKEKVKSLSKEAKENDLKKPIVVKKVEELKKKTSKKSTISSSTISSATTNSTSSTTNATTTTTTSTASTASTAPIASSSSSSATPSTTSTSTSTIKPHNPFILPQSSNTVKPPLSNLFLSNLFMPSLAPSPLNSINLLLPNLKPELLPNPLAPAFSNDLLMSSLNAINNATTTLNHKAATASTTTTTTTTTAASNPTSTSTSTTTTSSTSSSSSTNTATTKSPPKKPLISPLPTASSIGNVTSAANYTPSLLLGQGKAPLNPLQNLFGNPLGDLANFKAPVFPLNMNLLVPKLNTTIKKPIKRKISQTNSDGEIEEKNEMEGGIHSRFSSTSSISSTSSTSNTSTTTTTNTSTSSNNVTATNNGHSRKKCKYETDEKKRNVLERNRQAALKCRQKKKQWLISLQKQIDTYTAENEALQNQAILLQEEILTLRALLLTHKPCSINKNNDIINQTSSASTDLTTSTSTYL